MSINDMFEQIWEKKIAFFATFFVVFTLMYGVLFALDFLPEPPTGDENVLTEQIAVETQSAVAVIDTAVVEGTESASVDEFVMNDSVKEPAPLLSAANDVNDNEGVFTPTEIRIPKLSKTVSVLNPTSRTVADLDAALLEGVVRHPDSALLNQDGNVFILGHSSYLPNVLNKNFQAFNGIQNLEWGDTIDVVSGDKTFTYRVEKVYRAKASDLTVPIAGDQKKLTLATCNSFGTVDDRYIVEAIQIAEA